MFTSAAISARPHDHQAHNDVNLNQKREFSDGLFNQSHGSFEIVLAPVVLALVGLLIDHWLGLTPLFTIVLTIGAMFGAFAKQYYSYKSKMDEASARRAGAGLP